MFANDLKIPVEFLNKFAETIDIVVNYRGYYNESSMELIWPHYQNRYCLIYANTRLLAADGIMGIFSIFMLLSFMVLIIKFIFFFIVLRFRYEVQTIKLIVLTRLPYFFFICPKLF